MLQRIRAGDICWGYLTVVFLNENVVAGMFRGKLGLNQQTLGFHQAKNGEIPVKQWDPYSITMYYITKDMRCVIRI